MNASTICSILIRALQSWEFIRLTSVSLNPNISPCLVFHLETARREMKRNMCAGTWLLSLFLNFVTFYRLYMTLTIIAVINSFFGTLYGRHYLPEAFMGFALWFIKQRIITLLRKKLWMAIKGNNKNLNLLFLVHFEYKEWWLIQSEEYSSDIVQMTGMSWAYLACV